MVALCPSSSTVLWCVRAVVYLRFVAVFEVGALRCCWSLLGFVVVFAIMWQFRVRLYWLLSYWCVCCSGLGFGSLWAGAVALGRYRADFSAYNSGLFDWV